MFLMGEAVTCAVAGQTTPDGYYTLNRMLNSFDRHGGHIVCRPRGLIRVWGHSPRRRR
jgi:uncharacterized protein involved in oxidation of intracellular sulfur